MVEQLIIKPIWSTLEKAHLKNAHRLCSNYFISRNLSQENNHEYSTSFIHKNSSGIVLIVVKNKLKTTIQSHLNKHFIVHAMEYCTASKKNVVKKYGKERCS